MLDQKASDDMSDELAKDSALIDEAEPFTYSMAIIRDVFTFDYDYSRQILERFGSNDDIVQEIDKLLSYVEMTDLEEDAKLNLARRLEEEKEMISFSHVSRHSIVEI